MSSERDSFDTPPAELSLGDDEVQVWRFALDVPESTVARQMALLGERERERAERFRGRDQRRRFVVSHGLLRTVLGRLLDRHPTELRFREGPNGKPELVGRSRRLAFNLSHSHELALCAVTRGTRVGVDVERLRDMRDSAQLAERFFCASEERALAALDGDARRRAFFDAWTRKEAFIKARAETVFGWLRRVEVSLLPEEPARIVRVDDDATEAARWSLTALAPHVDYVGALVVEGPPRHLSLYRWP